MRATVSVNGKLSDANAAVIPVFDHGFLYGEGVYETLRTYGGVPFLFDRHLLRLRQSARLVSLDVPFDDRELRSRVAATLNAHGTDGEAYIRILLTRGVGALTYDLAACPTPSLVIIVKEFPRSPVRHQTEGISLAVVGVRRNHPDALDPRIKSNNLLNNALAMREALRQGAQEALMLNQAGALTECSQSSFFMVTDGMVRTPPLAAGLLPGITRAFVLGLARELPIPVREESLSASELDSADEAFITSTIREILAVTRIDARVIGSDDRAP